METDRIKSLVGAGAAYGFITGPFNALPLVAGALIVSLGFSETDTSLALSLEMVAMGAVAFLFGPRIVRLKARPTFLLSGLVIVGAHWFSTFTTDFASFLSVRLIAGLAAGFMFATVNRIVATSSDPVRFYGVITIAATVVGAILVSVLPRLIEPFGVTGAYYVLAVLGALLVPLALLAKDGSARVDVSSSEQQHRLVIAVVLVAALFIVQISQSAYYTFVEQAGSHIGLKLDRIGYILSVSYLIAIPGSSLATLIGTRFGSFIPLVAGLTLYAIGALVTMTTQSATAYMFSIFVSAFFYFFSIPYQLGLAAELDETGKLATTAAGVFFIGLGAGPLLGGALVTAGGYSLVGATSFVGVVIGLGLYRIVVNEMSATHLDDWKNFSERTELD